MAVLGFLTEIVLTVVAFQRIVQRRVYLLHKRQLMQEFQVQDLAAYDLDRPILVDEEKQDTNKTDGNVQEEVILVTETQSSLVVLRFSLWMMSHTCASSDSRTELAEDLIGKVFASTKQLTSILLTQDLSRPPSGG
jgi:hypothetical protein